MTKIKAVAELAGVSPATVSRVLSGNGRVQSVYRERVLAAVAELGYRPNRRASGLRRRKTDTIGIVVPDIENPHFTRMVRVIEDVAFHRGYRVLLCNSDETIAKQRAYLEVLQEEQVDGAIAGVVDSTGEGIGALIDAGIPVVALDRTVADSRADAVFVDNREAGRRGTEHLLRAGHRRVGFVGGRPQIMTGADRLAGYQAAMADYGLEPLVEEGSFRIDDGHAATQRLLEGVPDLTAIVVANNLMTIGALTLFRERGVRAPDEIALVAIDDPFWAELVSPPLTTLAQPLIRMAEGAARLLFERIDGTAPTVARHLVFDLELRVRESCGVTYRPTPAGIG